MPPCWTQPFRLRRKPRQSPCGNRCFFATRDTGAGGGEGIYTANGIGGFTTITLTTSGNPDFCTFAAFPSASINNLGTVAFVAERSTGVGSGRSLYASLAGGANPLRVIRAGDTLFGSTVTAVNFYRGLATDSNALAFTYFLANGVGGIARANTSMGAGAGRAAPALGSLVLLLSVLGAAGMATQRPRRRKM